MSRKPARRTAITVAAVFCGLTLTVSALRQNREAEPDPVATLASHLSHGIGDTPLDRSDLIGDPTNAAIILAARQGLVFDELRKLFEDAPSLDDRLAVLVDAGLIDVEAGLVRVPFPIVVGEDEVTYARLVTATAERIYGSLRGEIAELIAELRRQGWDEWSYHFAWSQLFDSQFTWAAMMERQVVPSLAQPVAWVIYPAHPFKSGTNYYPGGELPDDYFLMVSWAPDTSNTTGLIGGQWDVVLSSALKGVPLSEDAAIRLQDLGLLDDQGRVLVPVLNESDRIYGLLASLATRYVDLLQQELLVDRIAELIDHDRQLAFAMAYHDLSWDIVGRLEAEGVIDRPPALERREPGTERPSMRGVCAVVPVNQVWIGQVKAALSAMQ